MSLQGPSTVFSYWALGPMSGCEGPAGGALAPSGAPIPTAGVALPSRSAHFKQGKHAHTNDYIFKA